MRVLVCLLKSENSSLQIFHFCWIPKCIFWLCVFRMVLELALNEQVSHPYIIPKWFCSTCILRLRFELDSWAQSSHLCLIPKCLFSTWLFCRMKPCVRFETRFCSKLLATLFTRKLPARIIVSVNSHVRSEVCSSSESRGFAQSAWERF